MLEYQKQKFSKLYANYTLKVDPYILRASGYNPQETQLKIDEYFLHCIPATLSLTSCTLLLSLAEKEIKFFKEFKDSLISLNFAFEPAYYNKNTAFYLKGRFEDIKKIKNGVYTLVFTMNSISDSYKELFFYLSNVATLHAKFYKANPIKSSDINLTPVPFKSVKVYHKGKLLTDKAIKEITSNSLAIESDINLNSLNKEERLQLIIDCNSRVFKLTGRVHDIVDNRCNFSLNYNTEYIHTLSRFYKVLRSKQGVSDDSEEIEELEEHR